ncbi:MAG: TIGR03617 family F420-dependent LLM class oxidoreductase [Actinomycetota bacterium]|nr:TIGR03617 family F420-dependent LLM class oxidoreductase [Actinomycetota bacterium]
MKIDIGLTSDLRLVPERVRDLEAAGFDGVFTAEAAQDVFAPLVLAGEHTDLFCYTNIALALPRSPMLLATTGWDLQRHTRGQLALGLGSQIRPHIQKRYSAIWDRPVAQMREVVESIRAIHACWSEGTALNYRGEFYTFTLMTPMFTPSACPWGPPPLWLAALGPRMTRLAGEVSDGVLVHPFSTRRFLDQVTLPHLAEGIRRSGRSYDDVDLIVNAIVCVYRTDEEREEAIRGARFNLAFYGSTPAYRVTLETHGWEELQPELNRLTKEGRWEDMAALITDEVLHTIAVVGSPAEVGQQLVDRYADVAERLGLSVPYPAPMDLLTEVVDGIRAACRDQRGD